MVCVSSCAISPGKCCGRRDPLPLSVAATIMPPTTRKRGASPKRHAPTKAKAASAPKGKQTSLLASYQTMLVRHPFLTNATQAGLISAAGSVTAQLITKGDLELSPLVEQVLLTVTFISPIVSLWLRTLSRLRLHWMAATLVDQFLFSPVFNVTIFLYMSSVFNGGLSFGCNDNLKDPLDLSLTLTLHRAKYPNFFAFAPVHSTQAKAYLVWLPATLVREKFVPPHLAPIFVSSVNFVWSTIFAIVLQSA